MAPKRSSTPPTNAATASGSRMSHGSAMISPSAASSRTVGSRCSGLRLPMATRAPSCKSSTAVARPMPVPPPVTMAVRPFMRPAANGFLRASSTGSMRAP